MLLASQVLWALWFVYWGPKRHLALLAAAFLLLFSNPFSVGWLKFRLWPQDAYISFTGLLLTAGGLLICVWARVELGRYWSGAIHIKEDHRLIQTGPYAFLRHPIYAGFLLAILGSAMTLGEARGLLIIAATVMAYVRKIPQEERSLELRFGRQYEHYRRSTKALLPFLL